MKNILNKLGKSLLIPAIALSLNTKQADAQKLNLHPELSVGYSIPNLSKFKIYDDWESHFKGFNGDEQLINEKLEKSPDLKVGLNLGVDLDNFSVGLFSNYSITQAINQTPLAAIELHNWKFDYAKINEFSLKQKTPSIGAYIAFSLNDNLNICLKGSARTAEINEIKREDIYFSKDAKCDPIPRDKTEDLTQEFENTKTKTLLNKIGLEVQFSDDTGNFGLEGFYETDWKRINLLGLNLNFYFNLPKKKKDS